MMGVRARRPAKGRKRTLKEVGVTAATRVRYESRIRQFFVYEVP